MVKRFTAALIGLRSPLLESHKWLHPTEPDCVLVFILHSSLPRQAASPCNTRTDRLSCTETEVHNEHLTAKGRLNIRLAVA